MLLYSIFATLVANIAITSAADPPPPQPLLLSDAKKLLVPDYPKEERGWVQNSDGMYYISTNTHMPGITGAMIDWWFGYVTTTEQYIPWHPLDHVYSEWSGPHGNSTYINGNHLVYEKIGGELQKLRINFLTPAKYFGEGYKGLWKTANVSTAAVGTVSFWEGKGKGVAGFQVGHLCHLIHEEADGIRMRSRFWLGDVDGLPLDKETRSSIVPMNLVTGLVKHATEEMGYLKGFLADLYRKENKIGPKKRGEKVIKPWSHDF
ncbi:hypothetical protein BT63DRAFT_475699 [Microthyrium microscopicum]|uniref:DAPG hydrolase PhiG domain-containing protein n=1 Tax=Microthyrium microscopicum TaxID=703497 RepID=A0A6A6UNZ8_9PEZI|nr:hypothetical protein BT63DRAFT_475699 [Microthyrium microscopicum]